MHEKKRTICGKRGEARRSIWIRKYFETGDMKNHPLVKMGINQSERERWQHSAKRRLRVKASAGAGMTSTRKRVWGKMLFESQIIPKR